MADTLFKRDLNATLLSYGFFKTENLMNSPKGLIMFNFNPYTMQYARILSVNQTSGSIRRIVNFEAETPTVSFDNGVISTFAYPAFFDGTELWFTCLNNCENNEKYVVSSSGKKADISIFGLNGVESRIRYMTSNDGNTFYIITFDERLRRWAINKASVQPLQVTKVVATSEIKHICLDGTGKYLLALLYSGSPISFGEQFINVYNAETLSLVKTINFPREEATNDREYLPVSL